MRCGLSKTGGKPAARVLLFCSPRAHQLAKECMPWYLPRSQFPGGRPARCRGERVRSNIYIYIYIYMYIIHTYTCIYIYIHVYVCIIYIYIYIYIYILDRTLSPRHRAGLPPGNWERGKYQGMHSFASWCALGEQKRSTLAAGFPPVFESPHLTQVSWLSHTKVAQS